MSLIQHVKKTEKTPAEAHGLQQSNEFPNRQPPIAQPSGFFARRKTPGSGQIPQKLKKSIRDLNKTLQLIAQSKYHPSH